MTSEPETVEYISSGIVEDILRDWVDEAHTLVMAGLDRKPKTQYEAGQAYGASIMRNLYLAEPHLIASQVLNALKLAGWEPPTGTIDVTYEDQT